VPSNRGRARRPASLQDLAVSPQRSESAFRAEVQRSFPTIPGTLQSFEAHLRFDRRHLIQESVSGVSLSTEAISELAIHKDSYEGNSRRLLSRHGMSKMLSYLCVICVRLSVASCTSKGDRTCSAGACFAFRRSEFTLMYLVLRDEKSIILRTYVPRSTCRKSTIPGKAQFLARKEINI
jgi:hypothetical protein